MGFSTRGTTALLLAWMLLTAPPNFGQSHAPSLLVNGTPAGASHLISRVQNEWLLPLFPIARALGATIDTTPEKSGLRIRRADGAELTYDGRTGDIRNRLVLAGRVRNFDQYPIAANLEEIVMPASAIASIFEADISEDPQLNLLQIKTIGSAASPGDPRATRLHLNRFNYTYGLTANGRQSAQFADTEFTGIWGATRLSGNLGVTQAEGQSLLALAQGHVRAAFTSGTAAVVGDYGTNFGLDPLTTRVRGVVIERPVGGFTGYGYAGRSAGATFATLQAGAGAARFDTWIGGFNLHRRDRKGEKAFGMTSFSGSTRKGTTVAASFGRIDRWNQLKLQGSAGRFDGLSPRASRNRTTDPAALLGMPEPSQPSPLLEDPTVDVPSPVEEKQRVHVRGTGLGFSVVNSFTPFRQLSVMGEFERFGKNFLTAREDSRFSGQERRAGSIVLRPLSHISLTGGAFSHRLLVGADDRARGHNYGLNVVAPGKVGLNAGYLRSVMKDDSSLFRRFELTQYSLIAPRVNRFSFFGYFSLTSFGSEEAKTVNLLASMRVAGNGRLMFRDQNQLGDNHRYGIEWVWESPEPGLFLQAGLERLTSRVDRPDLLPIVGIRVGFTQKHSLEMTYSGQRENHMIRIQLKGALSPEREIIQDRHGIDSVVIRSTLQGRVYFDANEDGLYTKGVDQPIHGVEILAHGDAEKHKSVTNAEGFYRIDRLEPGAVAVKAEIGGVPADMVFADSTDRIASIVGYRDNTQNFRAVRTGRIIGRVTVLDSRSSTDAPAERPVPDARILAGGDRDAYSDSSGVFLLGDLAPGNYRISLDPESIPDGYVSAPPFLAIVVRAGETQQSARFRLVIPEKPVIQK